jgi:hypothetical protein
VGEGDPQGRVRGASSVTEISEAVEIVDTRHHFSLEDSTFKPYIRDIVIKDYSNRRRFFLFRWGLSHLPLLFVLTCTTANLWARAGGGEGYGGNSYNGGSGGGDGELIGFFIYLAIRHPVIGIPLLILFLFFGYKGNRIFQDNRMSRTIVRGVQKQNENRIQEVFGQIRERDPGFDPHKLKDRVKTAFLKVQDAWTQQNMEPARAFISDGILERWHIQFEAQKIQGIRNVLKNVQVTYLEIVGAERTDQFDTLHIKIYASCVDKWVSVHTNEIVRGKEAPHPFTEYWTFLRRPGAQTKTAGGLIEGLCPNCGAWLAISDKAHCLSCRSLIASGEYDWTLVKITQEEEWRFRESKREIPGVAAYLAADPMFNVSFIEDRISVVFWRFHQALLKDNPDPLRKLALPEFCDKFIAVKNRRRYGDVAEGLAEIRSVGFGKDFDKVTALVKWAGVPLTESNRQTWTGSGKIFFSHVFTLVRAHGITTNRDRGLMSLHCPGCGAPQTSTHQSVCDYCLLPLGDGSRDWVLSDISPVALAGPISSRNDEDLPLPTSPDFLLDPNGLLACLVMAAMADGEISTHEEKLIENFIVRRHIPKERVKEMLAAHRGRQLHMPRPETVMESGKWLNALIDICLTDGNVSSQEREVLIGLGKTMGHTRHDVDLHIRRRRTEMFKMARAELQVTVPEDPYA